MTHAAPESESLLSPEDLARFCEYLYRRTGLTFGETKRYYIDRRLAERMAATGDATFAAYFARLRTHDSELEATVNAFTVNETYFYREDHQLQCLTNSLLQERISGNRPGGPVRIWSAPCSTGEEAYTLAIWLLENWPRVDEYNIEIVGSDIDTQALDMARAGIFGKRALMRLTPDLFVAHVVGRSMEPRIPDGSLNLFRLHPAGSRQGKILLIERFGITDETARYTIKRYTSEKSYSGDEWEHTRIRLEPLNPEFEPWDVEPQDFAVVAEWLRVIE